VRKHTPGPWVVGPVDDTVVTHLGADGVRYEVARVYGDYNDPDFWPVMEAYARLVAAAPDVTEALKSCLNYIENTESELGIRLPCGDAARAALAKAEGRS